MNYIFETFSPDWNNSLLLYLCYNVILFVFCCFCHNYRTFPWNSCKKFIFIDKYLFVIESSRFLLSLHFFIKSFFTLHNKKYTKNQRNSNPIKRTQNLIVMLFRAAFVQLLVKDRSKLNMENKMQTAFIYQRHKKCVSIQLIFPTQEPGQFMQRKAWGKSEIYYVDGILRFNKNNTKMIRVSVACIIWY